MAYLPHAPRDPFETHPYNFPEYGRRARAADDSWMPRAKCRPPESGGTRTYAFFPDSDPGSKQSERNRMIYLAHRYCNGLGKDAVPCPVVDQCFWYAVHTGQRNGVWGGVCFDTHIRDKDRQRDHRSIHLRAVGA